MKHFEVPKPWTSEQIVRLAEQAPAAKAADWPGFAHACGHSPGSCRTTWVNLRAHLAAGKPLDSFGNGSRHNRKRIWTTGEKAKLYDLRVIGKKTFPVTGPAQRHHWGKKQEFPLAHKSERECQNGCGLVKVSRHEGNAHWIEFWRGLDKVSTGKTPACESVKAVA